MEQDTTAVVDRGEWTTGLRRNAGVKVGGGTAGTPLGLTPQQRVELRMQAVEDHDKVLTDSEHALDDRMASTEATIVDLRSAVRTLCGLVAESAEVLASVLEGNPDAATRVRTYLAYMEDRIIEVGVTV